MNCTSRWTSRCEIHYVRVLKGTELRWHRERERESPKRRFSQKTADFRRFTPSPGNSSIWREREQKERERERERDREMTERERERERESETETETERERERETETETETQETAENRRFSQETADFRRKLQIGVRHLRCVTLSSALLWLRSLGGLYGAKEAS